MTFDQRPVFGESWSEEWCFRVWNHQTALMRADGLQAQEQCSAAALARRHWIQENLLRPFAEAIGSPLLTPPPSAIVSDRPDGGQTAAAKHSTDAAEVSTPSATPTSAPVTSAAAVHSPEEPSKSQNDAAALSSPQLAFDTEKQNNAAAETDSRAFGITSESAMALATDGVAQHTSDPPKAMAAGESTTPLEGDSVANNAEADPAASTAAVSATGRSNALPIHAWVMVEQVRTAFREQTLQSLLPSCKQKLHAL